MRCPARHGEPTTAACTDCRQQVSSKPGRAPHFPLRRFAPRLEIIRRHDGRRLGLVLLRLKELQVELFLELAAELGALGPAHLGVDQPAGGEVELDPGPDFDLLAAFDQGPARRDISQPRALHLAVVVEQRRADDPDARFARRQLFGKGRGPLLGKRQRFLGRHRPAEDIALDERAAEVADQLQLVLGLDALGGGLHLEVGREGDDGADERGVAAFRVGGAADEGLVDLDLVERRPLQIAEARIAGAEIVERELHADRLQAGEHLVDMVVIAEEHAFGDLQLQPLRRQSSVSFSTVLHRGSAARAT